MKWSKFDLIIKIFLFSLLFLDVLSLNAQPTLKTSLKVHKVIDSNLFLTSSGDSIRLIGLCAPSVHSRDIRKKILAQKIKNFAREKLTNSRCRLVPMDTSQTGTILVMAYEQFLLQKRNLNVEFLKQGFARYCPHPAIKDSTSFVKAQQEAKMNQRGIWALEKYRPKLKNKFHYFKISGGILGFHLSGDYRDDALLPLVSIGSHYGDLLKFQAGQHHYLTLAAQVNALWAVILPIAQLGTEFYAYNLRVGLFTGKMFPIIFLRQYQTEEELIVHSLEIAKRSVKTNGKWHEFNFSFSWLPSNNTYDFMIRIEMNIPLF